jgi:hypothetical protein
MHSAEENKFIMDLVNRERTSSTNVWIGAKRNNSEDFFEWTNGQEFNYSNWQSSQPKSSTDPESHVVIYIDGTWGKFGMFYGLWLKNRFICESNSSDA